MWREARQPFSSTARHARLTYFNFRRFRGVAETEDLGLWLRVFTAQPSFVYSILLTGFIGILSVQTVEPVLETVEPFESVQPEPGIFPPFCSSR